MGLFRRKTRAQNDRGVLAKQSGFLGGMNLDNPASEIDETEVAHLDNLIPFRSYVKTRSGVKTYGNLPGVGDLHSIFEHEGNLKFVCHVGFELYYSSDNMQTWVLIAGATPSDASSDMKALSDDVVLFQEDSILRIEMENSGGAIARPINAANPTNNPVFSGSVDATIGKYLYRYTYTFARIVDSVLVAESGNIEPGEVLDPDYIEVYTANPISEYEYPTISSLDLPAGTYWTHIRLYRTLNIHPDLGGINNTEIYYLIDTLQFDQVTGVDEGVDFEYIIDHTLPDDDPGQPSPLLEVGTGDSFATSDDKLLAGAELLLTRFFKPIPNGIVNEITPGFMFVSARNAKKLNYSSLGDVARRVGYYQPAFQSSSFDDSIRLVVGSPDSLVVCCNKSTYRGTIFTERNVGNTNVGEVIAQLEPFTVIDSDIGVYDYGSIAKMDTGRFIAVCSDSSVRIWEGRRWGTDLSRFKVQNEIKKILDGSVGVYSSDGYYLLWYSTDKSDLARTKCLRYGLAEDVGKGWCFFSGSSFPFPVASIGSLPAIDPIEKKKLVLCFDHKEGTMVQVDTFDGPSGSSFLRSTVDLEGEASEATIAAKVVFRELTGSQESYFCIHQQSNIYVRPIDRDLILSNSFGIDVKIGADGVQDIDSSISVDATGDAFFFKESAKITGHRLQISVESNSNTEGFILRGYDTKYRVQDRRNVDLTSSENVFQKEIGATEGLWLTRPHHDINRVDAKALTQNLGSFSLAASPDSRTNALRLTTDFDAETQSVNLATGHAVSLWVRNVQTPGGSTLSAGGTNIFNAVTSQSVTIYDQPFGAGGNWDIDDADMTHFFFYESLGVVYLFVNGVSAGSNAFAGLSISSTLKLNGGIQDIFDLRVFSNPPSIEAIKYYIDDVLTNQGGITLPMG